jgi:hypothetical protein
MDITRHVVASALVVSVCGMLVMTPMANAGHPRPKGASPLRASLVPAYNACATPNRTHGTPLAFPSCNPPVQSSTSLTAGSPDANGAAANSVGFVRIAVQPGTPGPPEDSDVSLQLNITDVRCKAGVAACGAANAAGGADYTGEIEGDANIRITDHCNDTSALTGCGAHTATVVDIPFPVNAPCTATGSTAIGSTCGVTTTWNTVVGGPGPPWADPAVRDLKRANIEISQLQISDGGSDGVVDTAPNALFAVQGIFIP